MQDNQLIGDQTVINLVVSKEIVDNINYLKNKDEKLNDYLIRTIKNQIILDLKNKVTKFEEHKDIINTLTTFAQATYIIFQDNLDSKYVNEIYNHYEVMNQEGTPNEISFLMKQIKEQNLIEKYEYYNISKKEFHYWHGFFTTMFEEIDCWDLDEVEPLDKVEPMDYTLWLRQRKKF